jgi:hypothetical protein
MFRHMGIWVVLALLLSLSVPSLAHADRSGGAKNGQQGGQKGAANQAKDCAPAVHSGGTQVVVCPPVVQSGHALTVVVHSRKSAGVTLQLSYPDGTAGNQTAVTDTHGAATLTVVVSYAPVSRYATASYTVSVEGADVVQGTVRITQPAQAQPRLQVHPDGSDWCGDTGRCVVRNDSNVSFRVLGAQPGAQVTISISYPQDGTTASCPSNKLTGKSTASADGEYDCTLAISLSAPRHGRSDASLLVTVTITSDNSATPVTVQKRLWVAEG